MEMIAKMILGIGSLTCFKNASVSLPDNRQPEKVNVVIAMCPKCTQNMSNKIWQADS